MTDWIAELRTVLPVPPEERRPERPDHRASVEGDLGSSNPEDLETFHEVHGNGTKRAFVLFCPRSAEAGALHHLPAEMKETRAAYADLITSSPNRNTMPFLPELHSLLPFASKGNDDCIGRIAGRAGPVRQDGRLPPPGHDAGRAAVFHKGFLEFLARLSSHEKRHRGLAKSARRQGMAPGDEALGRPGMTGDMPVVSS